MSDAIQQLAKLLEESGAEMVFRHSDVYEAFKDLGGQIAAERTKVALAVGALKKRSHCKISWNGQPGMNCRDVRNAVLNGTSKATKGWEEENRLHPERVLCADCQTAEFLDTLQSADALADIRREVARECAEIVRATYLRRERAADLHKTNLEICAELVISICDAIRAKFGITS